MLPYQGFYMHTQSTAVALWASEEISMPALQEREGICAVILPAYHVSCADFTTSHLLPGRI